ncbi:MAG TPA: hypothetical protein PKD73_01795 [Burkholderiaceae bacterium]|nr:hypothetical protein [Burkholderiaceae bacterium]
MRAVDHLIAGLGIRADVFSVVLRWFAGNVPLSGEAADLGDALSRCPKEGQIEPTKPTI